MPTAPRQYKPPGAPSKRGTKSPAAAERSKHYRTEGWARTREAIMTRDLMTCQLCDKLIMRKGDAHVDHIVPLADGGTDDASNLRLLCGSCHSRRTAMDQARARGGR